MTTKREKGEMIEEGVVAAETPVDVPAETPAEEPVVEESASAAAPELASAPAEPVVDEPPAEAPADVPAEAVNPAAVTVSGPEVEQAVRNDYQSGKFTYQQLADKYRYSLDEIRRIMDDHDLDPTYDQQNPPTGAIVP
jgi:hypothetical protein